MAHQVVTSLLDSSVIQTLRLGGVVVLRTDTLYGILAKANDDQAVERVYSIKHRSDDKSPIVLISNIDQIYDSPTDSERRLMQEVWPGPNSVIVRGTRAPQWLRRNNASVAYRLPKHEELRQLLHEVGPVIAPSANPEGQPPCLTVQEAIDYFGDLVDVFVDGGTVGDVDASGLFRVGSDGEVERLR